ncbi:MAG: SGNH/GDSL hydrolase family protein, partial [Candidatus Dormibacteraeota bacterium]|nr:SGNH/GDSL hydrolase family protein [Candidatus Dormibacteraeota bacterium]
MQVKARLRAAALAVPIAVISALAGAGGTAAHAAASGAPVYYLSLGDSLAQGVQPNGSGQSVTTKQGYADDLYAVERFQVHGLRLEKLGCPGETTHTMIAGGICSYTSGSQLGDAVSFLHTHNVAFVTIDIGANNVDGCVTPSGVNMTCIAAGIASAEADLPVILTTLRTAAPDVPLFAMNYYDPFLAAWLQGPPGQALATESLTLAGDVNGLLQTVYGAFDVRVADVAGAFLTSDTSRIPFLNVPVNVFAICSLTWMCAPSPVGPNIHANAVGY